MSYALYLLISSLNSFRLGYIPKSMILGGILFGFLIVWNISGVYIYRNKHGKKYLSNEVSKSQHMSSKQ